MSEISFNNLKSSSLIPSDITVKQGQGLIKIGNKYILAGNGLGGIINDSSTTFYKYSSGNWYELLYQNDEYTFASSAVIGAPVDYNLFPFVQGGIYSKDGNLRSLTYEQLENEKLSIVSAVTVQSTDVLEGKQFVSPTGEIVSGTITSASIEETSSSIEISQGYVESSLSFQKGITDVTLGVINSNGDFQAFSFNGTTAVNFGSAQTVSSYKSWNSTLEAPQQGTVTAIKYYKCASVDTVNGTWSGYEASINSSTGLWNFSKTLIQGLTYSDRLIPSITSIYDENCNYEITNYNDGMPTNGLIRYAKLNKQVNQDELNNSMGYSGTYSFGVDQGIPCVFIQGTNNYITYSNPINGLTSMSISLWMKYVTDTNDAVFISFCYGSNPGSGELWISENSNGSIGLTNGTSTYLMTENNEMSWHNLIVVWTGVNGDLKLYIDGTLKETQNNTSLNFTNRDEYLWINSLRRAPSYVGASGKYSSLRVYNRVLTKDEITALANEFTPITE